MPSKTSSCRWPQDQHLSPGVPPGPAGGDPGRHLPQCGHRRLGPPRGGGSDAGAVNTFLREVSRRRGGTAPLTSAEANEVALEDARWGAATGCSPTSSWRGCGAAEQGQSDGVVTLGELFEYVCDGVLRETGNKQHPSIGTTTFDRRFPMAVTGGGPGPAPRPDWPPALRPGSRPERAAAVRGGGAAPGRGAAALPPRVGPRPRGGGAPEAWAGPARPRRRRERRPGPVGRARSRGRPGSGRHALTTRHCPGPARDGESGRRHAGPRRASKIRRGILPTP